jgi:hypothetical protein
MTVSLLAEDTHFLPEAEMLTLATNHKLEQAVENPGPDIFYETRRATP